jgi:hypothetical protein
MDYWVHFKSLYAGRTPLPTLVGNGVRRASETASDEHRERCPTLVGNGVRELATSENHRLIIFYDSFFAVLSAWPVAFFALLPGAP